MHDDLFDRVDELFPTLRADLDDLVRIPSVSAADFDPVPVRDSAEAAARLLQGTGLSRVRLLEVEGAHPAVYGEIPPPPGAPTVLLYAHHDVQPPGPAELWTTPPFEPVERGGRLYGRGTSDDKCGVVIHVGALRAHWGRPPVGVRVFLEGEEETGSVHLPEFLDRYGDLLAADVAVVADAINRRVGQPAVTTSLRGLVDCVVEVRTAEYGVHSGNFGGVFPDALTSLARTLASLHDDDGEVAVPGLTSGDRDPLDLTEAELRDHAGIADGVETIGSGTLTSRLWAKPSCSVLAIDAPPVAEAINQLVPVARAKVSLRLPPGQDPERAMEALIDHLRAHVPWGASVTVTPGASGRPFALPVEGSTVAAFRDAFTAAWGVEPVDIGAGGSVPFVAAYSEAYPAATILLTGVKDPTSKGHGPNESLDLDDFRRSILAEAIGLRLLAG